MNAGLLYAFGAYFVWGLFPLYFSLLASVGALEVLAVRIPVSLLFLFTVLGLRRHWRWLGPALRDRRVMTVFAGSTLAISVNWYTVIWASTHGHFVDAALGYYINPLVNVLIGFFVLKEPLSRLQMAALLLAGLAVGWLTWQVGSVPWISLILAFSFALYGLLRRHAPLGALEGLTIETLLLTPFALAWLVFGAARGGLDSLHATPTVQALLLLGGPLVAIPLLTFAAGARRISFSALGMLQYVSPTIQTLVAVWVLHQPFTGTRATVFAMIWIACALFSADSLWRQRRAGQLAAAT